LKFSLPWIRPASTHPFSPAVQERKSEFVGNLTVSDDLII
jgi:hypothetical protein